MTVNPLSGIDYRKFHIGDLLHIGDLPHIGEDFKNSTLGTFWNLPNVGHIGISPIGPTQVETPQV